MELKLLPEGDEKLAQECTLWDFSTDGDPTELVNALFKTLTDSGGIGLAAPQCGVMKTIFVMGNFTKQFACINPQIEALSDESEIDLEGCLSFPDLWLRVKRAKSCKVKFQNEKGEVVEREFNDLMARVFLHEFDHLIGVTFDERAPQLGVKMAKERRKKQMRRKEKNDKKK